ncbi:MAG: hypothetical protein ABIF88_04015 [archaeon]
MANETLLGLAEEEFLNKRYHRALIYLRNLGDEDLAHKTCRKFLCNLGMGIVSRKLGKRIIGVFDWQRYLKLKRIEKGFVTDVYLYIGADGEVRGNESFLDYVGDNPVMRYYNQLEEKLVG